jgi:hypothetical protein
MPAVRGEPVATSRLRQLHNHVRCQRAAGPAAAGDVHAHAAAGAGTCCAGAAGTAAAAAAAPAAAAAAAAPPAPAIFRGYVADHVDVEMWERDGYNIFPGILTAQACSAALASVQRLQTKMDQIVTETEWNAIDWRRWGLPPLPQPVTRDLTQSLVGAEWETVISAGLLPPGFNPLGSKATADYHTVPLATRGYKSHGLFPAMCPPCYDEAVLQLCCHEQMIGLHSALMGIEPSCVRFDHSSLLNRPVSSKGLAWHAHPYVQNNLGPVQKYTGLQLVRTLVYPEGSSPENGGAFTVIPGAHLLRELDGWRKYGAELLESEWFKSLRNPRTGEPFATRTLRLPPGSLVSFPAHMPHDVSPRVGGGRRYALLLSYRQPDPQELLPSHSRGVPSPGRVCH